MEDVLIAVGIVLLGALAAHRNWKYHDFERELARGWPSRARAWEDISRRRK